MIRLPARFLLAASAALAITATLAAPANGQENAGTFNLPTPTPTPTPAPAGPSDERAGVMIPPRAAPTPRIMPVPVLTPEELPAPNPRTAPTPTPTPNRATTGNRPPTAVSPAPTLTAAPSVSPSAAPGAVPPAGDPLALPPSSSGTFPEASSVAASPPAANTDAIFAFPAWELIAAGGVGALALLGGGVFLWRRRKPKVLRLAAPSPAAARAAERGQATVPDLADLHLTLDVTTATRSLMMFTLGYRLNIANRSGRAVSDIRIAVQLVCARASANPPGANVPSVGAAQALSEAPRIGPHQARTITGQVQLALSAIQPLRQGTTPLFVPLVHVTIEAEGQPALTKSFVIGTPSSSGRVHPIQLDQPPGGIAGLVAQAVAVPSAAAA